jgi:uncharacterized membrane protein
MRMLSRTGMVLLGVLFIAAGVNHFLMPAFYRRIMPPYLPWPDELVLLSGVLEIVFGLLLLLPRTRRLGAWGIVVLLILFLPVHIHMAGNPADYPTLAPIFLWLRLAGQGLLIAWAAAYVQVRPQTAAPAEA